MNAVKMAVGIGMILIPVGTVAETVNQELAPETVVAGFEPRVDAIFRAESGKQLARAEKRPPLGPRRGNYVRGYSYSMMAFAARCLYLNEMIGEANAALVENAQHYLDNPRDINDRDSFHWHAEIVMRLIEMYGTDGRTHAGRITRETESLVLRPIFEYAKTFSTPERFEHKKSQTWHIYESENHHVMSFTTCWHFAKLAKDRPEFREVKYNGATAAEHYAAWNDYFVVYCRERARKGMFIEMMHGSYNSTLIKGIYNFHDFGEPAVRRSAGMLLDLHFAYWAQEQMNGVQGGGKSRIYFNRAFQNEGMESLAWIYFGIGRQRGLSGHDVAALLSDYRPPAVVADLALDVMGRGRYEVRQVPRGLGKSGNMNPYRMNVENGGILRYTFCDPAFIIGTTMTEARPASDWTLISSQNRWQGVIFAGENDPRIVPIVRPKDNRVAFNGHWSVQSKGSLITQKLRDNKGAAEMIVWMSEQGLSKPVTEDGVIFLEAPGAYAAVRVSDGGFDLKESAAVLGKSVSSKGWVMTPKNEFSPVILEVVAKSDIADFNAFKTKVKSETPTMKGAVLSYKTIYGVVLTMDTSYKSAPTINGKPVNYTSPMAFDSPFLRAHYNSGIVGIRMGSREKILNFNDRN